MIHETYDALVDEVERIVGSDTTLGSDLESAGRSLFGPLFAGVYPIDRIPTLTEARPYAIVNLDQSHEPGSHWIALAHFDAQRMTYDSFGRDPDQLGLSGLGTDPDAEQDVAETNCGARCLAWLVLFHVFGPGIASQL